MLNNYFIASTYNNSILLRMPDEEIYPFSRELKEEEELPSVEEDDSVMPPSDIVAYNELRSCYDLVRMAQKHQLEIQPDYQRGLVWKPADQARFIDSLIKRLPIPSMCFSHDKFTLKRTVIDGLQRISTIISFLSDDDFVISKLDDIDPRISGKSVRDLRNSKGSNLLEEVENWTIPVTVIHCNTESQKHMEYLFLIFHRLNSGGVKLTNQEIRNCIFTGKLNSLLRELVKDQNFSTLFHTRPDVTYRFAFEELILRYFAFYDSLEEYNGKLGKFLNTYMQDKEKSKKNPKITDEEIKEKKELFNRVVIFLNKKVFTKTNKLTTDAISKTLIESVLVATAKNIDYLENLPMKKAKELFVKIKNDELFSIPRLKEGLAQKKRVQERINRAISVFSGK